MCLFCAKSTFGMSTYSLSHLSPKRPSHSILLFSFYVLVDIILYVLQQSLRHVQAANMNWWKSAHWLTSASVGLFLFYCKGYKVGASQLLCLLHERILQADAVTQILPAKGEKQEAIATDSVFFFFYLELEYPSNPEEIHEEAERNKTPFRRQSESNVK